MTLTLNEWKDYLNTEKLLKDSWTRFIQKKENEEAIFGVLTAHQYDNFEKQKVYNPDSMVYETQNFFTDKRLRWAYVKIRKIREGKYLRQNTINDMIELIQAIQACQKALDTNRPESHPWSAGNYPVKHWPDSQMGFDSSNPTIPLSKEEAEKKRREDLEALYAKDPDEPRWNR